MILIVEDEPTIARILQQQLELAGYIAQTADCGALALTIAAEAQPALIILDVKLPDMNGYDVCRKVRQLYHPWIVPVLMLTGMVQPVDQLRGFAHGADAYLTKPYDWPVLLSTIEQLLGQQTLTSP